MPVVVGGITSDRLYPLRLQEELAELLPGCSELNVVDSIYGHDGFLVETEAVGELIRRRWSWRHAHDRQPAALTVVRCRGRGIRARQAVVPAGSDRLATPGGANDVLDLGAGTGKLTTRLVERGLKVVAVDPIPEMLELLSNSLPDTPALLGTAEEIPLPDDSVDAVLVAQAWHWFDTERAVKEVARVLRPGGRLGLVWNARDERLGWVKDLGTIIGHEGAQFNEKTTLPDVFTDVERHRVDWTSYLTPQALIDLVASRSYCITSPEKVRTHTLDRVRELLATHPALANSNGLALPYVTVCIRATLS